MFRLKTTVRILHLVCVYGRKIYCGRDIPLKKLVDKNKITKYNVTTKMRTVITVEVTFPAQCSAQLLPIVRDTDLYTFEKPCVSLRKKRLIC